MSYNYDDLWCNRKKLSIFENLIKKYKLNPKRNILIYSCFGNNHQNSKYNNYLKIFYSAEPTMENNQADYIITFIPTKNKYICIRNYERTEINKNGYDYKIYKSLNLNFKLTNKKKFCCFIVSDPNGPERNEFFEQISKYKKIDSLGKYKNNSDLLKNIPREHIDYYKIISEYKFIICFERVKKEDYITEKIYNAFYSNTIPIYWGAPNITSLYNTKSFINIESKDLFKEKIELIKKLDNNDELYNKYFENKPIINPDKHDKLLENSINKIKEILSN
jgi:alpha(1,3/1,4) fucosyltransferase